MFLHLYKTRLKILLKSKTVIFWSLMFPFILGTLFYFAFSNIMEKEEGINTVPVAITTTKNSGSSIKELHKSDTLSYFFTMADTLSDEEYITAKEMDYQKGIKALKKGSIKGIITLDEKDGTVSLIVNDKGTDETILKMILDTYKRNTAILTEIGTDNPEKLQQAIKALFGDTSFRKELPLNANNADVYAQYFFALIAMTCFYGANFGLENTKQIQADQSMVGARRSISPTRKMMAVLSDFCAAFSIEMGIYVFILLYLTQILGVNMGNDWGRLILIGACGSAFGVSLGYFIGVFLKGDFNFKESMMQVFVLVPNFFAGLMVGNMKYLMEQNMPILNRINPAAIISDSFQYTSATNDVAKFKVCIVSLTAWSVLLFVGSILVLRREKYANL